MLHLPNDSDDDCSNESFEKKSKQEQIIYH